MSSLQDKIVRNVSDDAIAEFQYGIGEEYSSARKLFGPSASLHEAMTNLEEEVEEVRKLVYASARSRSEYIQRDVEIQKEAIQVATMAMALALENRPDAIPWFWEGRFGEAMTEEDVELDGSKIDWGEDPFMQGTGD